jgi:hypothetical protein
MELYFYKTGAGLEQNWSWELTEIIVIDYFSHHHFIILYDPTPSPEIDPLA